MTVKLTAVTLAAKIIIVFGNCKKKTAEKRVADSNIHRSTTHLSIVLTLPSDDMLTPILTISRPSYL